MLSELFAQHPPPWAFSDNREGHEGEINVYDDSGGIVVFMGDMEDCTMADILLARAIAAVPELLGTAQEVENGNFNQADVLRTARAALDKAGVKESRDV